MTFDSIDHESEQRNVVFPLSTLPPILPQFSVPLLDDRPQDPIARSPRLWTPRHDVVDLGHYSEAPFSRDEFPSHSSQEDGEARLWNQVLSYPRSAYRIMSWDGISPPRIGSILKMPFLTEQLPQQFGSIQQHVLSDTRVCDAPDDLVMSLRLLVLGSSSRLYVWDSSSELFVHQSSSEVGSKVVLVESGSWFIVKDYLQRFLDLGSLMRRMELLAHDLRDRGNHTDPTVHAFAHGLSTLLSFLREQLSRGPLFRSGDILYPADFVAIWLHYAEEERVISSIAAMCHRSLEISPENYLESSTDPVDLLSHIYQALEHHVEVASPRQVIAATAYMLTVSSMPYIAGLCGSVAYRKRGARPVWISEELGRPDPLGPYTGEDPAGTWQRNFLDAEHTFPKFVPVSLADVLPIARKSLELLEAAQPNHWILSQSGASQDISWLWSEAKILQAWGNSRNPESSPVPPVRGCSSVTNSRSSVLDEFKVFDLEPGSMGAAEPGHCDAHPAIADFMATFPESLPLIMPNLSQLCDLVFSPLESHALLLSRVFLSTFLDESSFLCVDAHLTLLRSHMLLTSHTFKSRLGEALFSDTYGKEDGAVETFDSLLRQQRTTHASAFPSTKRAVGLALALTARDSWPPGGSDLSFLLRTVIVDAQEYGRRRNRWPKSSPEGVRSVLDEAEFRLGFAVRDLPVGTGRERWLNPLSIEALDFLYLDYKVPHPMEVLITPTVLSKYQRIFSFLLRLMRGEVANFEAAVRAVYRLTCLSPARSVSEFPLCGKLVWQFRFAAHSFVSTLLTYVYDVAIGGNFDAFLSQIATCRERMSSNEFHEFRDVFALSEFHSSVLDDILSACLLRSSQRAAGDILRGTMELVLEFCVFVTDPGAAQSEHEMGSVLRTLYSAFRKKVVTLLEALDVLLEKDAKFPQETDPVALGMEDERRVAPGGTGSLRYLSARLDLGNWRRNVE